MFQQEKGVDLEVFVETNFTIKARDKRHASGAIVIREGAAMNSFWRTQKCVTFFATEAENVALSEGGQKALFVGHVRGFLLPGRGMLCTKVLKTIRARYSSRVILSLYNFEREAC